MMRSKRNNFNNSQWDTVPLKISYRELRKIQERAFKAGYELAEFTYRDREFKAPGGFDEWFDGQSKRIGGYLNDSQDLEILGE